MEMIVELIAEIPLYNIKFFQVFFFELDFLWSIEHYSIDTQHVGLDFCQAQNLLKFNMIAD